MANYAFISDDENIVTEVIVGRDEDDLVDGVTSWEDHYSAIRGQTCLRTSYNTNGNEHSQGGTPYRYNYAGIGYTFDETKGTDGAFIPPQPFDSWVLDEETCLWEPPVPMPEDGYYIWNESTQSWDAVSED